MKHLRSTAAVLACLTWPLLACDSNPKSIGSLDAGTETSTDTTSGAMCEDYADEVPPLALQVHVTNTGQAPVLLPTDCGLDYIDIVNAAGWFWPGLFCTDSCQAQMSSGCGTNCGACVEGQFIRIEAGGTYEFEWDLRLSELVTPPAECFEAESACASECPIWRVPTQDEPLQATVKGISLEACMQLELDPELCACVENDDGWCEINGNVAVDGAELGTLEFTLAEAGGQVSVEVAG